MIPSVELKQVMLQFYASHSLRTVVSCQDGVLLIGTDPDEWWSGSAAIEQRIKTEEPADGLGYEIKPGNMQAFVEGTVGWVADTPTFELQSGRELHVRLTSVLHKEDGAWKVVQHHVSIGVPNEQVLGHNPT